MDRQKMLQEIQDKIGDRTLSTGCIVFNKEWGKHETHKVLSYTMKTNGEFDVLCDGYELYDLLEGNIIGHPVSLSRVLSTLGDRYIYKQGSLVAMIMYDKPLEGEKCYFVEIPLKLLNEDGSDAYLDDQSDETIEALHKILVRK